MKSLYIILTLLILARITSAQVVEADQLTLKNYYDNFLCSNQRGYLHHLIGTYPGWDKEGVFIAGYNSMNGSFATKRVYIGQSIVFDLTNNSLSVNGNLSCSGMKLSGAIDINVPYCSSGNYISFGQPGVSEDFIGYGSNAFYFMDSPGGGDVSNPNVVVGGKVIAYDGFNIGTKIAGSATDNTTYGMERSRNRILFEGYRDALSNKIGASIDGVNKQTYSHGALELIQSTDLVFKTTPPNTMQIDNTIERMRICDNGNVGIGTSNPKNALDVVGTIRANEIKVEAQTADFVFEDDYQLKNLTEVEDYIMDNNHLPDVPSAAEMESNGVNLAEMNKLLLQKVEELTLYLIQQQKEIEALKQTINQKQ